MKKTLLGVAMLLASTGVFAQLNIMDNTKATHQAKVLDQTISDVYVQQKAKKIATKGQLPENAKLLTDFSEGTYTKGVTASHTASGTFCEWLVKPDTTGTWPSNSKNIIAKNAFGLADTANWYHLEREDWANMSAHNGFAYIDFLSIQSVDKQNNTVFDAWIQANTPIKTYGKRGIDIYLSQIIFKFNRDQYFIEWSHDADFAVKDSMEFNIRDIDIASNDYEWGTIRVTLPTNTSNCPLISTDADEDTYIRVRAYAPASAYQPHSYLFIIDDLSWDETPENRVDVKGCDLLGGYHILPDVVEAEPFYVQVMVNNSGSNDVYNATVKNLMVQVLESDILTGYDGSDSVVYRWNDATINSDSQDTLVSAAYEVTSKDANNNEITILRDHEYLYARKTPQLNDGVGSYGTKVDLSYDNAEGETTTVLGSPYTFRYNVTSAAEDGSYIWARDRGLTHYDYPFDYGYLMDQGQVYVGEAATSVAGYKVCLGFNAVNYKEPVYAWGVQVYPALDSASYVNSDNRRVQEGAVIRASLWQFDPTAETMDDAVVMVYDENDNPIESDNRIIQSSDYNIFSEESPDGYGRVYTTNMNSVYLPFTNQGTELQPNTIYYACYEQVINGKFKVAKVYEPLLVAFRPGISFVDVQTDEGVKPLGMNNIIIWSPNITAAGYQYAWGRNFYYDYNPMIRLVISKQKGGLNDAAENTSSINVFPNPAKDNAVLNYTLATSGNVTIEVTDIMGRTVLSYNEGNRHAGINNKANIEASKLANGTYFCTVNVNGAKVSTSKMVVNR